MIETKKYLRSRISELKEDLESKNEEISDLKSKLSGEHSCTYYCGVCKHGIAYGNPMVYSYYCELEAKCKDFERKNKL